MSMLARVKDRPELKPPRLVIHGRGGVGKTTFGASMRKPVLMPLEEGLGILAVPHFERPMDFDTVIAAIDELRQAEHEYASLVVDTADHLEPLIWSKVCQENSDGRKKYEHIEDFGYGKGYNYADPHWVTFFRGLDALRRERNMSICVLCHNEVKTVDDPQIGPYDRVTPKLHKRANALLHEWADIVGYLDIERSRVVKEGAKGREITTARSDGKRVLYLEDRGGFVAKNRFRLPHKIEIPEEEPFSALRDAIVETMKPKES